MHIIWENEWREIVVMFDNKFITYKFLHANYRIIVLRNKNTFQKKTIRDKQFEIKKILSI